MKAVVFRSGKKLVFEETPRPELGSDEVLIKVSDTGFCGSDHSMVEQGEAFLPDGFILGHETSGVVADMGAQVTGPKPGDRVIVRPTYCGVCPECLHKGQQFCRTNRRALGVMRDLQGAFAEYTKVFPQMLIPIPDGVDSRNAAMVEMFASSYHGLRVSGKTGGPALVTGGGPIGLALVQLLKIHGFTPVILSEPVGQKRELGRQTGADVVLDPFQEDVVQYIRDETGGRGLETIFECSGAPGVLQTCVDAAAVQATVCSIGINWSEVCFKPRDFILKEIHLMGSYSNTHAENKQVLTWMAEGRLDGRPLITDLVTLEELPRVYKERIATGQAVKVLIRIGEEF